VELVVVYFPLNMRREIRLTVGLSVEEGVHRAQKRDLLEER
jgi:hypothetical protein